MFRLNFVFLLIGCIWEKVVARKLIYAGIPEQISISYSSKPTEMVVTWAVFGGQSSDGQVQYGTSAKKLDLVMAATDASVHSIFAESGESNDDAYYYSYAINYTSPMIYKATMIGLKPGNRVYYYRVGSETSGYSVITSFKSHPGISTPDVTFHVMGDLGQTNNSINTLKEIVANENALTSSSGGIISMGDNSYANRKQYLWDEFGNMKQFAAQNIPMFSTPGNHEWYPEVGFTFIAYKARHDNPFVNGVKELYYSFDAGLVHWIMVAGYCPEMTSDRTQPCLAPGTKQYHWLKTELATVDREVTPWVFVVFHQPYVNSNLAHGMATEGLPMQTAIEDLLYEGKVDIVFTGHVHAYERSCQVYRYKCVNDAPFYITIGDGGNAEGLATKWEEPQPRWSLFRQSSYGHGELRVFNATHVRWEWNQNGDLEPAVSDSVWIVQGDTSLNALEGKGVTAATKFAPGERGDRAKAFNEVASLASAAALKRSGNAKQLGV